MSDWCVRFSNAFARMVRGSFAFPKASDELEQLIRELIRDEIQAARLDGSGE